MKPALDIKLRITGGKNLAALDPEQKEFLPTAGEYVRRTIYKAVHAGHTPKGVPLPRYKKRWADKRRRHGKPLTPNYDFSGQMWRSLKVSALKGSRVVVGFSGGRRTYKLEKKQTMKVKRKDGTYRVRAVTNPMVAAILSFRSPGQRLPQRPRNYVPRYAFMVLGKNQTRKIDAIYRRLLDREVKSLPDNKEVVG